MIITLLTVTAQILTMICTIVNEVEAAGTTGEDKRRAVIDAVQRFIDGLPIPSVIKAILMSERFLGFLIDRVVQIANDKGHFEHAKA